MSDGVAYMAHVAGFMSGLMYMFLFKKRDKVQSTTSLKAFYKDYFSRKPMIKRFMIDQNQKALRITTNIFYETIFYQNTNWKLFSSFQG